MWGLIYFMKTLNSTVKLTKFTVDKKIILNIHFIKFDS